MRTILASVAALILGLTIGLAGDALATPPPAQNSTEARLQALEYLLWQEHHAINAVSQRVWDRVSTCNCYLNGTVLMPFAAIPKVTSAGRPIIAQNAVSNGTWYAEPHGDGDGWHVWVIVTVGDKDYGPISWDVWQSNGFIQGRY
jgi:hypothetical protein